jgi:hypothetical protein
VISHAKNGVTKISTFPRIRDLYEEKESLYCSENDGCQSRTKMIETIQHDKYVSILLTLRTRGLREDFLAKLAAEPEPKYRASLKRCIDALDSLLTLYGEEE